VRPNIFSICLSTVYICPLLIFKFYLFSPYVLVILAPYCWDNLPTVSFKFLFVFWCCFWRFLFPIVRFIGLYFPLGSDSWLENLFLHRNGEEFICFLLVLTDFLSFFLLLTFRFLILFLLVCGVRNGFLKLALQFSSCPRSPVESSWNIKTPNFLTYLISLPRCPSVTTAV
jgi:hypothetical protein